MAGPAYDSVGHRVGRPEDYPFRVLLTIPEAATIPIFALGIEAQRKEMTEATGPAEKGKRPSPQ